MNSILQPEKLKACEESLKPEAIRRLWPREVAEKSFIDYLWSQYDYTQLGAIEVCSVRGSFIEDYGLGYHKLVFLGTLWFCEL